jgi:CubicO group peptidase (beta-lactamase class C family)
MKRACILGLAWATCVAAEAADRAPVPPDFARTVAATRALWNVPGVAVGVVQDGKVTYAEGFGQRELGRPEPVDGDTIFGIASVTKLLVTGAVAVLANEGKVDLDAPVVRYLPDFRLADPYVAQHVTLRDLLSHRSGIDFNGAAGGIAEQLASWDSAELVRRSGLVGQDFELRARRRYNDFGFLILAEVIGRVSGQPWNEFIRQRVAEPLGMRQTWARSWDFLPRTHVLPTGDGWSDSIPRGLATLPKEINIAVPHIMWPKMSPQLSHDPRELERTTVHFHRSPIDPCQSAWTSARDLATYAAMWLNDGRLAGAEFLKPKTVESVQRWGMTGDASWPVRRRAQLDDRLTFVWDHMVGQAAGFAIFDYLGHVLTGHDGYELGYNSMITMDRERGLAVVVLVNNALFGEGEYAMNVIGQAVLDWHYGLEPIDRNPVYFERFRQESSAAVAASRAEAARRDAGRNTKVRHTLPLSAYAGLYEHPYVGKMQILVREGKLVATVGETAEWRLAHWRGDVFEGDWQGAMVNHDFFEFRVGLDGAVHSLRLPARNLEYSRVPDR